MANRNLRRLAAVLLGAVLLAGILLCSGIYLRYERRARVGIDALLQRRTQALAAGDVQAYLATVDPQDAILLQEEKNLVRSAAGQQPLQCTAELLALQRGRDGMAARVTQTVTYGADGQSHAFTYNGTFVRRDGTWYFAGYTTGRAAQTVGEHCTVTVHYSAAKSEAAAKMLHYATQYAREYAALYGALPHGLRMTLYDNAPLLQGTVAVGLPTWVGGWYEYGESIRLYIPREGRAEDYRATLCHEMSHLWVGMLSGDNAAYWLQEGLATLAEGGISQLAQMQFCAGDTMGFAWLSTADLEALSGDAVYTYYRTAAAYTAALCNEYGIARITDALRAMGEQATPALPAREKLPQTHAVTMAALEQVTGDALTAADMDALRQKWSQSAPGN